MSKKIKKLAPAEPSSWTDRFEAPDEVLPPEQEDSLERVRVLALEENELLKVKLALAEAELASTKATLLMLQKQMLIRVLDPENKLGAIDQEVRLQTTKSAEHRQDYNKLFEAVEARFGIKMSEYCWDDTTGVLTPVG